MFLGVKDLEKGQEYIKGLSENLNSSIYENIDNLEGLNKLI